MADMTALVPETGRELTAGNTGARLLGAFLSGLSPRTLAAYGADLRIYRQFVGAATREEAAENLLRAGHGGANALVLDYRARMMEAGLAPATINRRLTTLRASVRMARTLGFIEWTLDIPGLKSEAYRDTRGPGIDSVSALIVQADTDNSPRGLRDRAILRLLHDLALRRGEVVSLNLCDVDLETGNLFVVGKGKTEKSRMTLPGPTMTALRAWIGARGIEPGPLFLNFDRARKGKRLTGTSVGRIIARMGREIGIEVHPHGLRHSAITEALDLMSGDVRAVQRFSRHADVRTLYRYDDNRRDVAGEVARKVAGNP